MTHIGWILGHVGVYILELQEEGRNSGLKKHINYNIFIFGKQISKAITFIFVTWTTKQQSLTVSSWFLWEIQKVPAFQIVRGSPLPEVVGQVLGSSHKTLI